MKNLPKTRLISPYDRQWTRPTKVGIDHHLGKTETAGQPPQAILTPILQPTEPFAVVVTPVPVKPERHWVGVLHRLGVLLLILAFFSSVFLLLHVLSEVFQ